MLVVNGVTLCQEFAQLYLLPHLIELPACSRWSLLVYCGGIGMANKLNAVLIVVGVLHACFPTLHDSGPSTIVSIDVSSQLDVTISLAFAHIIVCIRDVLMYSCTAQHAPIGC